MGHRDSDTESTRAMDSDLLEQALQASKADDPSIAPNGAPAVKPGAAAKAAAPAEVADWFAMLHGKQTGPVTRIELAATIDQGEIGPRTYLWKDGMDAWHRAKDLSELAVLFPQLPSAPPLPPPVAPRPAPGLREFSAADFVASAPHVEAAAPGQAAPAASIKEEDERTSKDPLPLGERVHQEGVASELFAAEGSTTPKAGASDLAGWAAAEMEKTAPSRPPPAAAPLMFESAAPRSSRGPFAIVAIAVLAVAAVLLWLEFGSASASGPKTDEAKDGAVAAAPETQPAKPADKPAEKPPVKPAAEPAAIGLTADQVRKKLDENKASLQTCIDEALRRDPNLRVGKIHIATTIAPSGQVTTAKIDKSTVEQSPLGACLRRATKKIAFPPFGGEAFDVDIPIVVTAGE
jgi:hypothetical protein